MDDRHHRLVVRVIEARGLANKELFGKSDPFFSLKLGSQTYVSTVIKNNLCPKWDQTFVFTVMEIHAELTVTLWAKDMLFKDDFMGTVTVSLADFKDFRPHDHWYPLEKRSIRSRSRVKGDVHLWMQLLPPGSHAIHNAHSQTQHFRFVDKEQASLVDEWCLMDNYDYNPIPSITPGHQIKDKGKEKDKGKAKDKGRSNSIHEVDTFNVKDVYVGADHWDGHADEDEQGLDEGMMQILLLEREERRAKEEEDERLLRQYLATLNQCMKCGAEGDPGWSVVLECDHSFCPNCITTFVRAQSQSLAGEGPLSLPCPSRCGSTLPEWVIKRVLPTSEYEALLNRMLQRYIDTRNDIFRCPNNACGVLIERVSKNLQQLTPNGEHKDIIQACLEEYRMRCRECSTEFCSECKAIPYHHSHTCESYETYQAARHCRFCMAALASSESLICGSEECTAKNNISCKKQLPCGHLCGGIFGEAKCLPCLDCTNRGEEFCNICWVEALGAAPCLQLDCKHVFHSTCLKEKLRKRWPTARITFGFAECPLCKSLLSHPSLKEEMTPILELKEVIESKAAQRLEFEGLSKTKEITDPTSKYYNNTVGYAMHRYAYFMCAKCVKPYFAGQRRCDAGDDEDKPFDPNDLLCGGCSGSQPAAECSRHGKEFLEWKCQFCCSVSSWYCWGKTHFCNDCHTKQQKGDYLTKKPKNAIPMCPGPDKCPLGISHPHCEEFLLGCALCRNLQSF